MLRLTTRLLPALLATLLALALGAGSIASAHGDRDRSGHHHGKQGDSWRHHHGKGHKCGHHRAVSPWDERWLTSHMQTNLFEIAGGQLAQQQATSDAVRALGAHIAADHTGAQQQAAALAERKGIAVPTAPSPLQAWALRAVATFSGDEFDRWFVELQIAGHEQAIEETAAEVKKGCNRKIRRFAAAILPVLQEHLEEAQAILAATPKK